MSGEKLSEYWGKKEPSPLETRGFASWVEEQIAGAMERGEFAALPGKGKPLELGPEHPWENKDWMANHILSNAKVVPEWVQLDREIQAELAWLRVHPRQGDRAERIARVNRLIDRYNFLAPLLEMQRARYRES